MPHWLKTLLTFHWLLHRNKTTISVDDVLEVADEIDCDTRGKGHPTRKRRLCQIPPRRDVTRNQTGRSITSSHSKRKKMSANKKLRLRRLRAQEMRVRQRSAYSTILDARRKNA